MEETMTTFEQLPEMMAILLKKVESLETSISEIKDNGIIYFRRVVK